MRAADSRTLMLAFRAWLEGESAEDAERNARRIAEVIYAKALAGHIGYFRHLFDMVDGKIRRTAEEEGTFEADCVIVVADAARDAEIAIRWRSVPPPAGRGWNGWPGDDVGRFDSMPSS
jgi:hypothetical protein